MMKNNIILLVDDNPDDVFLAQRALKKSNIANEVVVAMNGEEALDYLFGTGKYAGRNLREMPVVILLDLKMPKLDGFEVLKQVRGNPITKLLPVVILTASKEDVDLVKSYVTGCNAYVSKPVDFNQFADAVKQLGLFWLVLNQTPSSD